MEGKRKEKIVWYGYSWFGLSYDDGIVFPFENREQAINHYRENHKKHDTEIDLFKIKLGEIHDYYTGE